MLRRSFLIYVVLPIAIFEGYLIAVRWIAPRRDNVLFSEQGVIELGTAAFFFAAGFLALDLALRTRRRIPDRFRTLLFFFALAALFVTLEEVSYGQHLFGWKTPEWFARHSTKNEVNVHNLYGGELSDLLRLVASVGFPIAFVVTPLVAMSRSTTRYRSGHWSYYLLPKMELITTVVLAQSVALLESCSKWILGNSLLVRPGEVQEFFWALAAIAYVAVLRRRLLASSRVATNHVLRPLQLEPRALRSAA